MHELFLPIFKELTSLEDDLSTHITTIRPSSVAVQGWAVAGVPCLSFVRFVRRQSRRLESCISYRLLISISIVLYRC